jgi:hypothetical protein
MRIAAALAFLSAALAAPHAAGARAGTEAKPMHDEDRVARTSVEGQGARLEVAFDPDGNALAVRYRISNTGKAPLAVFDRGDRHAVLTKTLVAGNVPAPRFEDGGDGLVLSHAARALPSPAPTVPAVPLAAKLAPGGALDGAFSFDLSLGDGAGRVRWCLGVAAFDEARFQASESAGDVAVWTAPFDMADAQQLLCTPWFDLGTGMFEAA